MMRYSAFAPRLYNLCKRFGFRPGRMLPSRAFCSDESQGYPIILLAKHFGAFPFNHGRVGGVVSTDRHGPHATHGEDLVLIQASHVGYEPEEREFGRYRRLQTEDHALTPTCGKLDLVLDWYRREYRFACEGIVMQREGDRLWVTIDNQLLREERSEGLILRLDRIIASDGETSTPSRILSTAKTFPATAAFASRFSAAVPGDGLPHEIGDDLTADLFHFRHAITEEDEGRHHLERNLLPFMSHIITATAPLLLAAQLNTQVEFDRTFRTFVRSQAYRGKRLLFISGLHIDISPRQGQIFPLTKYVPWAAYLKQPDGSHQVIEQDALVTALLDESTVNDDQVDLEEAIQQMAEAREVHIDA